MTSRYRRKRSLRSLLMRCCPAGTWLENPRNQVLPRLGSQQDFLRHRVSVGICDQVLADLGVDVVVPVDACYRVEAYGNSVGDLVGVVGWTRTPIAVALWSMRWNSRSVKARKFHKLAYTCLSDLAMPSSSVSSGCWVLES